jgi:DNA-binding transcriptional regulator YdaS (Cro superfamily)
MKMSKALRASQEEAMKSDSYWVEAAKIAFAMSLERQRVVAKMAYGVIARKLGTSAAYISKVFRGDTNMTIETMVKLARATGGELRIEVRPTSVNWSHIANVQPSHKPAASHTLATFTESANDENMVLAA